MQKCRIYECELSPREMIKYERKGKDVIFFTLLRIPEGNEN